MQEHNYDFKVSLQIAGMQELQKDTVYRTKKITAYVSKFERKHCLLLKYIQDICWGAAWSCELQKQS